MDTIIYFLYKYKWNKFKIKNLFLFKQFRIIDVIETSNHITCDEYFTTTLQEFKSYYNHFSHELIYGWIFELVKTENVIAQKKIIHEINDCFFDHGLNNTFQINPLVEYEDNLVNGSNKFFDNINQLKQNEILFVRQN
jgi:hypothetical protein